MARPKTSPSLRTLLVTLVLASFLPLAQAGSPPDRAAWMKEARWGVMTHYLADWIARRENTKMSVEEWNRLVDGFDAPITAKLTARRSIS